MRTPFCCVRGISSSAITLTAADALGIYRSGSGNIYNQARSWQEPGEAMECSARRFAILTATAKLQPP